MKRLLIQWAAVFAVLYALMIFALWSNAGTGASLFSVAKVFGVALIPPTVISVLGFFVTYFGWKSSNKALLKQAEKNRKIDAGEVEAVSADMNHLGGLPIAENESCTVSVYADRLTIKGAGASFTVPMNRVVTAQRIEKEQYESIIKGSVGKALVWNMVAGPVAGIVAGAPRSKEVKKYTEMTCIYYINQNGENGIMLFSYSASVIRAINEYATGESVEVE